MDFPSYYRQQRGFAPFPWQAELAKRAAEGKWPANLDIATGLGKTDVITIWAWAALNHPDVTPTRLIYVVDRRLIVDAAAELADRLDDIDSVRMRGGIDIDDGWLAHPARPTVILSTVDQAGSRLLFRGYGISPKAAPIHAGLLGEDALWIIDEAHISAPLVRTLSAVGVRSMTMTATPLHDAGERFGLTEADHRHPVVQQRLATRKPARLIEAKASGGDKIFIDTLAKEAREAMADLTTQVVAVVVNRTKDARALYQILNQTDDADTVLLMGRVRPGDRVDNIDQLLRQTRSGSRDGQRTPLYVVATQTIEVGADLDFDALISESAPIPSLRQRFGRLDRLGELGQSRAVIVHRKLAKGEKDWIYGDQTNAAWSWLWANKETREIGKRTENIIDLGLGSPLDLSDAPLPEAAASPALLPATQRALAQTTPPTPIDIAPYLHGWNSSADVTLVWRSDLSGDNQPDWADKIKACPPRHDEMLQIPLYAADRWLQGRADQADAGDSIGTRPAADRSPRRPYVLWTGDPSTTVITHQPPQTGDILVLPAETGGCDRYGWAPHSREPVSDLGDSLEPGQIRLRLPGADLDNWPEQLQNNPPAPDLPDISQLIAEPYPGGILISQRTDHSTGALRRILLSDHLNAVGRTAERNARQTRLPPEHIQAVIRAARLHDLGKAHPGWQARVGGDMQNPLAKGPPTRRTQLLHPLPKGWRHEMLSAAKAAEQGEDELVQYLIGSHHGHGRPTLPHRPDPDLWQQLGGLEWGGLFHRLNQHIGIWRLAYLEALVRSADWHISHQEQQP